VIQTKTLFGFPAAGGKPFPTAGFALPQARQNRLNQPKKILQFLRILVFE
jgi:hypothetical protein